MSDDSAQAVERKPERFKAYRQDKFTVSTAWPRAELCVLASEHDALVARLEAAIADLGALHKSYADAARRTQKALEAELAEAQRGNRLLRASGHADGSCCYAAIIEAPTDEDLEGLLAFLRERRIIPGKPDLCNVLEAIRDRAAGKASDE